MNNGIAAAKVRRHLRVFYSSEIPLSYSTRTRIETLE